MPITTRTNLRHLTQDEFGAIAFDVMEHAFAVHNEMGRFLDENIYRRELVSRIPAAEDEVRIDVCWEDFHKPYRLDLLVMNGAPFELKAVDALAPRHRAQLANYLHLTGLQHGKLVNFRPELVQHEFVNTSATLEERRSFSVADDEWQELGAVPLREWVEALLRDWGTALDVHLYEEAMTYRLGGEARVVAETEIVTGSRTLGAQKIRTVGDRACLKISALSEQDLAGFETHARRFLKHTRLEAVQWINVARERVTFKTVRKDG